MSNSTVVVPAEQEQAIAQESMERVEAVMLKILKRRFPRKQITPNGDKAQLARRGYRVDRDGIMRHGSTVISAGGWPF